MVDDDTPATWWQALYEDLPPHRQQALDRAAMILETLANCSPGVWKAELQALADWVPLPKSQWEKYAAGFRQAANALEGRPLKGTRVFETPEAFHGHSADTRYILRLCYIGNPNPFERPLPSEFSEAATMLRVEAQHCAEQARRLHGDRSTGIVARRQQCVQQLLARAKHQKPRAAIATLLGAIGWTNATVASIKMAQSRRGETSRPPPQHRPSRRVAGLPRKDGRLSWGRDTGRRVVPSVPSWGDESADDESVDP